MPADSAHGQTGTLQALPERALAYSNGTAPRLARYAPDNSLWPPSAAAQPDPANLAGLLLPPCCPAGILLTNGYNAFSRLSISHPDPLLARSLTGQVQVSKCRKLIHFKLKRPLRRCIVIRAMTVLSTATNLRRSDQVPQEHALGQYTDQHLTAGWYPEEPTPFTPERRHYMTATCLSATAQDFSPESLGCIWLFPPVTPPLIPSYRPVQHPDAAAKRFAGLSTPGQSHADMKTHQRQLPDNVGASRNHTRAPENLGRLPAGGIVNTRVTPRILSWYSSQ